MSTSRDLTRRAVIVGGATAAAALPACSSDDPSAPQAPMPSDGLLPAADVPVGGAVAVDGPDGPLLVAQPTPGEVVAFSAICTHQGCTVQPDGERLRCPCHGSVYDAATGDNIDGPAPSPLPSVAVEVVDGQVRVR